MKKSQFSEEKIVFALKQVKLGTLESDVSRKPDISAPLHVSKKILWGISF